MVKLTRAEQETIISFSSSDSTANVYSTDPVWIARLKKMGGEMKGDYAIELTVPKKWVKVQKPRELSERHKECCARALEKAHAKKRTQARA